MVETIDMGNGLEIYVEKIISESNANAPTIIFVNAAFATSKAYQWAKDMLTNYNLIFYDLPRRAKPEKKDSTQEPIIQADVDSLVYIISKYKPEFLFSSSWGGYAAIHVLAKQRHIIKRAIVASFASELTQPMQQCMAITKPLFKEHNTISACNHFMGTLGKNLPHFHKRVYQRYFKQFTPTFCEYIIAHFDSLQTLNLTQLKEVLSSIESEVLFLNGSLDIYTPAESAAKLIPYVNKSNIIELDGAGHFFVLESEKLYWQVNDLLNDYFQ